MNKVREKEVRCPGGCEQVFQWPDDYYKITMHLAREHDWDSTAVGGFVKQLEKRMAANK